MKLGTIITVYGKKYFVVHVEGYQPEKIVIENNKYIKRVVDTETVKYKVIAIPEYKESNKRKRTQRTMCKFLFLSTIVADGTC